MIKAGFHRQSRNFIFNSVMYKEVESERDGSIIKFEERVKTDIDSQMAPFDHHKESAAGGFEYFGKSLSRVGRNDLKLFQNLRSCS